MGINLYSLQGTFIKSLYAHKNLAQGKSTIKIKPITEIDTGIYLVQIKIGTQEKWVKIVKE
ncbi:MAG: T9SS type A sorting domain-containing protein [bacterium]|nr:T9SS type A sorting domain-containing protein [bacterium]